MAANTKPETVPTQRRDNSETNVWLDTDPMTLEEIAKANGFYGWQKFRRALEVDWKYQGDKLYTAEHKGKRYRLYLETGTDLPDGWRLHLVGQKHAKPVAAAGRSEEQVLTAATLMVVAQG